MKHKLFIFGIAALALFGVGFSVHTAHATPPLNVYHAEFWNVDGDPFAFDFLDPGTPVFEADYSGIYIPTNTKLDDSINDEYVTGRFTKTAHLDVGTYSFLSRQDDGVRVYVSAVSDETHEDEAHMLTLSNIGNGQDETGSWDVHGSDGNVWKGTTTIDTAGDYKIIVEYSQNTGYYGMLFDYYKGTGTTDDPYLITDCNDLQFMNIDVTGAYKLNNDIDCAETSAEAPVSVYTGIWRDGNGFWPIGDTFGGDSDNNGFYGSLDGDNKTISDLYINRTDWEGVGLIGFGGNGVVVKDLTLAGENISGNTDVGGLFGELDYGATITNVIAGGAIYADSSGWCGVGSAGGLIGYLYTNDGNDVSIADSSWGADGTSTVTAYIDAGGIIGNIYVQDPTTSITIDNTSASFAIASESTPSNSQGGMIGYAEVEYGASVKVQNGSQATMNFPETSVYDIGGIAGYVDMGEDSNSSGNTFTINDTTTDGTIASTNNDLGGMVGYFYGADSVLSIENKSHSSVNISGGDDYIGGMVGEYYVLYTGKLKITDSSAGGSGAGVRGNDAIGGLVGYGSAEHGGSLDISGSSTDFSDENQLSSSNNWEADMGGFIGYICHYTSSSMSITDSHTNINLATENQQDYYGGMIGGLCGGTSSTFTIDNSYADGTISSSNNDENTLYGFGGLIGWADFDSVSTVSILNGSHSDVDINLSNDDGDYYSNVGGLIGETSQSNSPITINITDSYNSGTISTDNGENIGGLVGYAYMDDGGDGSLVNIENSYNKADMGGEWVEDVGGLVGYANYFPVSISDSYSTGNITGGEYLGGLIGSFGYEGSLSIADSHATGDVTGYKDDDYEGVGGILGWAGGNTTTSITHSYGTGNISGGDSVGGLVGVGYSDAISLDNTYATGDISGTRSVGGLVGYADIVDVNHSYASGDVTGDVTGLMWDEETQNTESETAGLVGELEGGSISNSFSAGKVTELSGLGVFTAGLVGEIDGTIGDGITLTNNYYDKTRSGQSDCGKTWDGDNMIVFDVAGQCQSVTTNNYFIDSSSHAPLNTWDFSGAWYKQGNDYPKFTKGRSSGGSGGSTGGSIGGGGGSVVTPVIPPVVSTTAPSDCKTGFMFSPSSGKSCAGVTSPSNSNSNSGDNHAFPGLLKYKSVGDSVLFLQQSLNKLGFTIAPDGDGSLGHETTFFGLKTVAAVKAFQTSKGLMPDGMVGPMTWNAILTALGM